MGFLKQKTSDTSSEEADAAKAARLEQEKTDAGKLASEDEQLRRSAFCMKNGKTYSNNPDAVRKRGSRKRNRPPSTKREKAAVDAEKAAASPAEKKIVTEFENETHYLDARGRKRARKKLRSLQVGRPGPVSKDGKRMYNLTEKAMVLAEYDSQAKRELGTVSYVRVAEKLIEKQPTIFNDKVPLSSQAVRVIVKRRDRGEIPDARGRPPALPEPLFLIILAALTSVVSARTTIMSAPMLQPVAIGCIIAAGHTAMLNEARRAHAVQATDGTDQKRARGIFCCGVGFIKLLMKAQGWRSVRPQGDVRKLPTDWEAKCWAMVLRLAYFVFAHQVPRALVINADHTGIMFTQVQYKYNTSTVALALFPTVLVRGGQHPSSLS